MSSSLQPSSYFLRKVRSFRNWLWLPQKLGAIDKGTLRYIEFLRPLLIFAWRTVPFRLLQRLEQFAILVALGCDLERLVQLVDDRCRHVRRPDQPVGRGI